MRLTSGPFERAQALNLEYLRALDVDRLLAPYRTEAGLQPKAKPYPNWESTGLQGHTAGHYLAALAQAWAATGDAEMRHRLDYMVRELAACQRANGNGYVGAIPGSRKLWAEVGAGRFASSASGSNGAWVPWYNLHKLFAGLRDTFSIAGIEEARQVLIGLSDWCGTLVAALSDSQLQMMLTAEHGGMNEVLADVFALTGDRKYLTLAERFSHRALLEPLRRHEDPLTGLHANTQIPKVVGYARIAELGGDATGLDAAAFFWQRVVGRRTVAFGGNSVREHFNPADDFSRMIESREGPETCNTYNMLRLTEQLFDNRPTRPTSTTTSARSTTISSRHSIPGTAASCTSRRSGRATIGCIRSRRSVSGAAWARGSESQQARPLRLRAQGRRRALRESVHGVHPAVAGARATLRQETDFPDTPATRLVLALERPQRLTLHLRHPAWVSADGFRLRINGDLGRAPRSPRPMPPSRASGRTVMS